MGSRQTSGSIILDVGSQRSTQSGLSTLARQLSEELEELRQEYGSPSSSSQYGSPELGHQEPPWSWGRRYGGLRGPRVVDEMEESSPSVPNVVLAQLSSSPDSGGHVESPMRMPIDITFVSPSTNVPEDVESSRASSILSPINDDEVIRECCLFACPRSFLFLMR